MTDQVPSNTGHGHVFPRPDGVKARCGGPAVCNVCAIDFGRKNAQESVAATEQRPSKDLTTALRLNATAVEQGGYLHAAYLMRHAADELDAAQLSHRISNSALANALAAIAHLSVAPVPSMERLAELIEDRQRFVTFLEAGDPDLGDALNMARDMVAALKQLQSAHEPSTDLVNQMRLAGYHDWASRVERLARPAHEREPPHCSTCECPPYEPACKPLLHVFTEQGRPCLCGAVQWGQPSNTPVVDATNGLGISAMWCAVCGSKEGSGHLAGCPYAGATQPPGDGER